MWDVDDVSELEDKWGRPWEPECVEAENPTWGEFSTGAGPVPVAGVVGTVLDRIGLLGILSNSISRPDSPRSPPSPSCADPRRLINVLVRPRRIPWTELVNPAMATAEAWPSPLMESLSLFVRLLLARDRCLAAFLARRFFFFSARSMISWIVSVSLDEEVESRLRFASATHFDLPNPHPRSYPPPPPQPSLP